VSGNAIPAPEVEPQDPEANTVDPRAVINNLSPANALIALNRSAPRQDLSYVQMPIGSPTEENVAVCRSMSVSAVPMSVDENMPVLVHAYAPISSPGQPSGADQPRPMPSSLEFQSLVGLLSTVAADMKAARNDTSLRFAEMHEILSDVEGKMLQRESHFMSEIEARTLQQQEVMQAYQESLRAQVTVMQAHVTRQREEMKSSLAQQQKIIQSQVENRFSELRDALLSRDETVAVETLPATQSLSVSTGMEHAHKCMNEV